MEKQKSTFYVRCVSDKRWSKDYANRVRYILISGDLIEAAKKIVYKKGRLAIWRDSEQPKEVPLPNDYLFGGNIIRITPLITQPATPCIELHSETKKGLVNLIKDLGLPEIKVVSQE